MASKKSELRPVDVFATCSYRGCSDTGVSAALVRCKTKSGKCTQYVCATHVVLHESLCSGHADLATAPAKNQAKDDDDLVYRICSHPNCPSKPVHPKENCKKCTSAVCGACATTFDGMCVKHMSVSPDPADADDDEKMVPCKWSGCTIEGIHVCRNALNTSKSVHPHCWGPAHKMCKSHASIGTRCAPCVDEYSKILEETEEAEDKEDAEAEGKKPKAKTKAKTKGKATPRKSKAKAGTTSDEEDEASDSSSSMSLSTSAPIDPGPVKCRKCEKKVKCRNSDSKTEFPDCQGLICVEHTSVFSGGQCAPCIETRRATKSINATPMTDKRVRRPPATAPPPKETKEEKKARKEAAAVAKAADKEEKEAKEKKKKKSKKPTTDEDEDDDEKTEREDDDDEKETKKPKAKKASGGKAKAKAKGKGKAKTKAKPKEAKEADEKEEEAEEKPKPTRKPRTKTKAVTTDEAGFDPAKLSFGDAMKVVKMYQRGGGGEKRKPVDQIDTDELLASSKRVRLQCAQLLLADDLGVPGEAIGVDVLIVDHRKVDWWCNPNDENFIAFMEEWTEDESEWTFETIPAGCEVLRVKGMTTAIVLALLPGLGHVRIFHVFSDTNENKRGKRPSKGMVAALLAASKIQLNVAIKKVASGGIDEKRGDLVVPTPSSTTISTPAAVEQQKPKDGGATKADPIGDKVFAGWTEKATGATPAVVDDDDDI